MKPKAVVPLLLAASVAVSLWVAGPFGTIGFIVRSPIILMNDLISVIRQALVPATAAGTDLPPIGLITLPVSTSGLATTLQVIQPSQHSAPTDTQVSPTPTPTPASPPGVLVPPSNEDPVEEILQPAEPVLDPVQSVVDPIVDSAENVLQPVTDPVEKALEPVTEPVEKAIEPVKDTIGGSGGGNTPDVGGAVNDVKSALDKIGAP